MCLSSRFGNPSNWTCSLQDIQEVTLSPSSTEYNDVLKNINDNSGMQFSKITRVQNRFLYQRYQLRKMEYTALNIPVREMILLHATAKEKINSIITNNLDWRLVTRAKFGHGVSFSPSAIYANKECNKANGWERAMIVAKVLVGRTSVGSFSTKYPEDFFDTTTGNLHYVYVKYYDDEFYPEYVAYYTV